MRAVVGRAGRSATAESGTDPGRRKSVTGNRLVGMILGPDNTMAHEWLGRSRSDTRPNIALGTPHFTNGHVTNLCK
jgi:hypothetical protein